MKRYLSPPTTFLAMWAFAALLISSTASAQVVPSETDIGQIVGSFDDFLAETTGTLVCEDIPALLDTSGNPILLSPLEGAPLQASQPIASGQLSFEDDIRFLQFPEDGVIIPSLSFSSPLGDPQPLVLDLDPDLGKVEGLYLEGTGVTISLFDGDTLLDTFTSAFPVEDDSVPGIIVVRTPFPPTNREFGFINTQGLNITRVELSGIDVSNLAELSPGLDRDFIGAVIRDLKVSFCEPEPEPEPEIDTCFDQLADVKAEVEALLATSTGKDARLLASVVDCICWTQHDCFWVQPSGDRLTAYGSNVFLGNAYSILYLEHVSDPQADVIIDQLLAVLECLVDREIEYAIANGGRQANIDKAMDFADLADVIDDEFDNQVVASLAYKLAWINAYYATY